MPLCSNAIALFPGFVDTSSTIVFIFLILCFPYQLRMDGLEKSPHVVTGNAPNKPREKRTRSENELYTDNAQKTCDQRPARRMLAFQGKGRPLQQVL